MTLLFRISVFLLLAVPLSGVNAQEDHDSPFTAGADLCSSYIFRGTTFGSGPQVQPLIKYHSGFLTAGAWGSFDFNGFKEADLFISFALPAGFSAGITDYYYPDLGYFDFSQESGSHAYELNAGFAAAGFSFSAYYIVNNAGGAGSAGSDKYFQAGYSFSSIFLFAGAGDGWHTSDGKFSLCNLGLGIIRKVKITELLAIPVSGQVIVNPEREKMFLVIALTL